MTDKSTSKLERKESLKRISSSRVFLLRDSLKTWEKLLFIHLNLTVPLVSSSPRISTKINYHTRYQNGSSMKKLMAGQACVMSILSVTTSGCSRASVISATVSSSSRLNWTKPRLLVSSSPDILAELLAKRKRPKVLVSSSPRNRRLSSPDKGTERRPSRISNPVRAQTTSRKRSWRWSKS